MVTKEQIYNGLVNYLDNEVGKKAVGIQKFVIYFAMPTITKKANQYINDFASNPLTKDMFVGDLVDIDALYSNAKSAMQKSGMVEIFGIIFNESDIDKLYAYIRGQL